MRAVVVTLGAVLACAIAFGRAPFGVLGSNTVWYATCLALPYLIFSLVLAWRIGVTARAGRTTTRAVWLLAALSWISALGFAVTVPDVQADGTLAAIAAPPSAGAFALEMAVALCNPFVILTFVFMGVAIAVAAHNSREPYVDAD